MPFTNTTLTTLLARLAEKYDAQPFWTADQARRAINEGLRIWNAITGMWRSATVTNTVPNDPYLFVSGTLVKGTRVSIGGRVLVASSLFGFDHGLTNWEGSTTLSGGVVPTEVSYWAPLSLTVIALYPADAAVAGHPITIDGVRSTTILVNGGDFIDMGDDEINTLLGYALHVLSFSKGIEALTKTLPLKLAFFNAAAMRNDVFKASSLYRRIIGMDRSRFSQPMQAPPGNTETALVQSIKRGE